MSSPKPGPHPGIALVPLSRGALSLTVVRVQALGGRPSVARPVPGGGAGPGSATMGRGPVAGARTGRRREDWVGEQQRLRSHPKQSHTAVACVGGGTLGRGGDGESRAACTAKALWDSVLTDRSREAAGAAIVGVTAPSPERP